MIFTTESVVALLLCVSCAALLLSAEHKSPALQEAYGEALLSDTVVVFYKSGASRDLAGAIGGGVAEKLALEGKMRNIATAGGRCVGLRAAGGTFSLSTCGGREHGKRHSAEVFAVAGGGVQRAIISTFD